VNQIKDAVNIQKFRPKRLSNCSEKIITKILKKRLVPILDRLIDHSQSAFIKGRFLLDSVITAYEVLPFWLIKKQKELLVKLDFDKAYDMVNWDFLTEVMHARGFGMKWIRRIQDLLQANLSQH
jgi:hypothetical protein